MSDCPFCDPDPSRIVRQTDGIYAMRDGDPVAEGHTLVIPRRHIPTYFDATQAEQHALWDAVLQVRAELDRTLDPAPDGYNVGFNAGQAAGQTVMHLHIHVIPRRSGDMDDAGEGARGVIPSEHKR